MAVSAEQTTINALASLTSLLLWFIRNLLLSLYDFLTSPSKLKVVLNNTIIHDWICRIASCEYLIQPLHVLSNQKGIQLFDECLSLLTIILSDFQISVEGVLQIEELIDKMQPSYRTNSQVDHSDRTIEIYLLLVAKQMVTPAILRTAERISKLQIIVNNSFTLCTAILDSFRQPLQLNAPSSPAWNQSRDIIYTNLRDNLQKILGRAFISKAEFRGSVIVLAKSLVEYEERSRFLQNRKGHKQYIVHMSKEMKEQSCSQSLHSEPENISERQLLTVEIIQSLLELLQLAYEDGSQVQLFGLDLLLQIAYTEAYELPLRTCLLRSPHRQSLETLSLSPNPKINQKIYQLFQVLEIE